ncbi:MAG: hypothetical protein O9301_00610 [Leptospira sp.]|nr:hypothetical protein [Leptospira sp.]
MAKISGLILTDKYLQIPVMLFSDSDWDGLLDIEERYLSTNPNALFNGDSVW